MAHVNIIYCGSCEQLPADHFRSCPYGPMDKAPAYGAGDSGFESQYGLVFFLKNVRGDARIELATSCTRSRNHTTRPITLNHAKEEGRAGVEPATYRAATNCSTTELTPLDRSVHTKNIWRSRVSIPVPPACKAGALPFELHPRIYLHNGPQKKRLCANRESNPALKLGKLQCYRYTIGANVTF